MTTKKKNRALVKTSAAIPQRATPAFVTPMAAQVVKRLPEGDEWIYELKFDGYRALLLKDDQRVEIRSRKNKDLTRMYPRLVTAGLRLNAEQAVVDGEIVALDTQGRPSFQALQHRGSHPAHEIVFYAFDLRHLDGTDLMAEPLAKRRARLARVLDGCSLLSSQELPGTPAAIVEAVRGLGLEGVIAKRKERRCTCRATAVRIGRSSSWRTSRSSSSAATAALQPHHIDACPFVDLPTPKSSRWGGGVTAEEMREMQWVRPKLVAQIRFVEWTAEGRLRHAALLGLRSDKSAREVRREWPGHSGG